MDQSVKAIKFDTIRTMLVNYETDDSYTADASMLAVIAETVGLIVRKNSYGDPEKFERG